MQRDPLLELPMRFFTETVAGNVSNERWCISCLQRSVSRSDDRVHWRFARKPSITLLKDNWNTGPDSFYCEGKLFFFCYNNRDGRVYTFVSSKRIERKGSATIGLYVLETSTECNGGWSKSDLNPLVQFVLKIKIRRQPLFPAGSHPVILSSSVSVLLDTTMWGEDKAAHSRGNRRLLPVIVCYLSLISTVPTSMLESLLSSFGREARLSLEQCGVYPG